MKKLVNLLSVTFFISLITFSLTADAGPGRRNQDRDVVVSGCVNNICASSDGRYGGRYHQRRQRYSCGPQGGPLVQKAFQAYKAVERRRGTFSRYERQNIRQAICTIAYHTNSYVDGCGNDRYQRRGRY